MVDEVLVQRAQLEDIPAVAALAGQLVRMHHATDPGRFFMVEHLEEGYADWFARELKNPRAVLLVAKRAEQLLGYAYGSRERRDWDLLLDAHAVVHDVFVVESARSSGVGRRLVAALIAQLKELGVDRIVLSTMVGNKAAQKLFSQLGFRPTMLEMTRNEDQPAKS